VVVERPDNSGDGGAKGVSRGLVGWVVKTKIRGKTSSTMVVGIEDVVVGAIRPVSM
jgi:hypothetical protein